MIGIIIIVMIVGVFLFFINRSNRYDPIKEAKAALKSLKKQGVAFQNEIVQCGICKKTAKRHTFTIDGESL
tara:strand:- start:272 stop:484 length:213 start_codon:yes stop_codon:yes gene_type:complete